MLQVFRVIILFDLNVVLMLPCWPDATIVQSDVAILVPLQLSTGSIHHYIFLLLSPSGYSIRGTENSHISQLYVINVICSSHCPNGSHFNVCECYKCCISYQYSYPFINCFNHSLCCFKMLKWLFLLFDCFE